MNPKPESSLPSPAERLAMVERMLLIRRVEERLGADFKAGKLIAGVHLYSGQEAVGVGVCQHLRGSDWIASNHRGHGHFLAKGGDVRAMMAEIHAKATGVCKGMGGTMHVADLSKGILGANGIVGGGISLICGAAYSQSLQGQGGVSVAFFGDGASTQGVMSEALNLSALWKLPMIFICENNLFSEFSRSDTVVAGRIVDRGLPLRRPCNGPVKAKVPASSKPSPTGWPDTSRPKPAFCKVPSTAAARRSRHGWSATRFNGKDPI